MRPDCGASAPVIPDARTVELQQRRRQRARRRRQGERRHPLLDHRRYRRELGQPLDPGLRLRRLAGLGAETIDEGLQVVAFGFLLGAGGRLQPRLFRTSFLEVVVAAGVEIKLAFVEVHDGIDRIVQELAVVADDQRRVRISLQPRLEPECAFEVEIVGGLVEQQQIGLRKQRRRQRHPHAPAAGEFRHRTGEIGGGEAKPAQDLGGTRRRAIGIDLDQPGINVA
jgi:hypothetical protein